MCLCPRCGAQGKRHVFCASPLEHKLPSANTSSFPVAFVFFRKEGAEAGPVRNLKERWGVGTESVTVDFIGVFGKAESLLQTEF